MKKIVFGITDLNRGGAERVLVDLVNQLCTKYDITIFTLYGDNDFAKQISSRVNLLSVYPYKRNTMGELSRKSLSFKLMLGPTRKKIYDEYIKGRYDVEIAFLEGPMTWIFSTPGKKGVRKIAWVHNDIEAVFGKDKHAGLKQKLNKKVYKLFNELVFVSNDNLDKFYSFFGDTMTNKRVIYNYLDIKEVRRKADASTPKDMKKDLPAFVQVSRLVDQKAVERLLDVHKRLIDDGVLHRIYIVGDGPLKSKIESKIKKYKVEDTFILLGGKDNPYIYMKSADCFMLCSYYEGYPMVLLEAEALSKYILITDTAARETIIGYNYATLVNNDEEGIYKGIKEIATNKPKVMEENQFTNNNIIYEVIDVIEGK